MHSLVAPFFISHFFSSICSGRIYFFFIWHLISRLCFRLAIQKNRPNFSCRKSQRELQSTSTRFIFSFSAAFNFCSSLKLNISPVFVSIFLSSACFAGTKSRNHPGFSNRMFPESAQAF